MSYALLLVDPRSTENFKPIFQSIQNIDPLWPLYFFGTPSNRHVTDIINSGEPVIKNRKIIFKEIPSKFMISPTAVAYSKFFMDPWLWNNIDAEHILVIQTDVVLCGHPDINPKEFSKFPYIGCAYSDEEGDNNWWKQSASYDKAYFYGVGGMSMRKKSFMLSCIDKITPDTANLPEDVFFSTCLGQLDNSYPKPKAKDMHRFCVETDYSEVHGEPLSLGVHKPELMRNPKHKERLLKDCPAAIDLLPSGEGKEDFVSTVYSRIKDYSYPIIVASTWVLFGVMLGLGFGYVLSYITSVVLFLVLYFVTSDWKINA